MADVTYMDNVSIDFGIPCEKIVDGKLNPMCLEPLSEEELETLSEEQLLAVAQWRENRDKLQVSDPVTYGWTLDRWRAVNREWKDWSASIAYGGNRCLAPESEIYDPVAKIRRRVDEIKEPFHVYAWDGEKRVIAEAGVPFRKTNKQRIYDVLLASGDTFRSSSAHRVMDGSGNYQNIGSLQRGDVLFLPWSTQDTSLSISSVNYLRHDYVWDFEVPIYHNYILANAVHHNSSKSSYAARVAVYIAKTVPGAEIVCWSVDETSSINDQQRLIYEALPEIYRNMSKVKGKMFSVQYSQKNGFSGNKLIIPNEGKDSSKRGSSIIFKNYRSYQLNPQVAEGWKAHFVWLDEECPSTLFETMRKRLWDYRGRLLLTFTTLQGWTSLINNINSKAIDKKRRYADKGKPPRYVPYEQFSVNEDKCKIWYFWTQDNPFIPYEEAVKQVSLRPDNEIMARLYGICTKSSTTKFPKFNRNVHVLKHDQLPWIKDPGVLVTRYQTLDPAGKKKWYFIYAGVTYSMDDDMPNIYIYDEFPDWSYGAWGLTDETPKGKPGPAQKGLGTGIKGYKAIMEGMEGSDDIFERGIDKRFAKNSYAGMEGETRLLDQLLIAGLRYITPQVKRVDKVNEIELGCQSINDYLDYDEHQSVGILNAPHFYISERCMNLIECMENFTGEGGDTEVWKDGIDCVRILMDLDPRVVNMSAVYSKRESVGY